MVSAQYYWPWNNLVGDKIKIKDNVVVNVLKSSFKNRVDTGSVECLLPTSPVIDSYDSIKMCFLP